MVTRQDVYNKLLEKHSDALERVNKKLLSDECIQHYANYGYIDIENSGLTYEEALAVARLYERYEENGVPKATWKVSVWEDTALMWVCMRFESPDKE